MQLNGIAHIQLNVHDLPRAVTFYKRMLSLIGMRSIVSATNVLYMMGAETAVAITQSGGHNHDCVFERQRIGRHHICLRARSRDDIDMLHAFVLANQLNVIQPPEDGPWDDGYYSMLFEDAEGIRLGVNFVPDDVSYEDSLPVSSAA